MNRLYRGRSWQYLSFLLFLCLFFAAGAHAAGGDPLWQFGDSRGGKQEAKASMVDKNGDVVVTGYQALAGGSDDFYTVKFKGDGSGVAWRAVLDRSAGSDQGTALALDSKNDVIVTGFAWSGRNTDILTVKYSGATGEVLWQHSYNGGANGVDRGTTVCVDADDNVYVGGYTQNSSGGTDYLILKYAPAGGAPLWQATYHGSAADANRVNSISAGNGGVAVTGESWNAANGAFDFATVKYGYDGALLWERRYTTATADDKKRYCSGRHLRLDAAGNVVVTGSVSNGIDLDIYTAKLSAATGATMWERSYNGAYDDEPYGVVIDQGAVYVAGYTWTLTGTNDFYTARYDGDTGELVWGSVYDSGNGNDDITVATGIVVDPAGDVFVTGYTIAGGNYDYKTVKYKKDDGTQLWFVKYDGSAGLNDRPVGLGLSPKGEVLVSGWSDSDANDLDYYVIKYDPGLLNAPSNLTAQAASNTSIRISFTDNSANEERFRVERCQGAGCSDFAPILSGGNPVTLPAHGGSDQVSYLDAGLTPNRYYSYRVSAANGANGESHYSNVAQAVTTYIATVPPVWSYSYNGVASQEEAASAIAVGPDGNPVLAGYSRDYPPGYSAGASYDYVTLKLSRLGGSAPLWSARYNDPNTRDDFATCLSVDSSNRVSVSGYATLYNGVGADVFSLYTLKYSGSGALIASDQYNGPVPSGATDDRSVAIATASDASGSTAVVGYGLAAAGNDNIYLLKYNADGSRAWAAIPFDGAGGDDLPTSVAFAPDGSIYVTGYSERAANGGVYKFFTARYNGSTGALIWRDLYGVTAAGDNKGQALAIDSQGNVYVTGSAANASGNRDIYTMKYRGGTTSPERIWERSADGAAHGDDGGTALKIDPSDGNIVVAGTVVSALHDSDYRVIKYTPAGDVVYDTTYFRPGTAEEAQGMAIDSHGYVYVTGHTDNSDGLTIDALTVRFDSKGGIVGATIFNGGSNGNDDSVALAINSRDEVFVAGYSQSTAGKEDILVYMMAPPEPRGVSAASVNSTQADLSWSDNPFGESSFRIERCLGAACSDFTAVGSALPHATTYNDATLCSGGVYRYRVVAVGNGWESLPSAPLTVSAPSGQPPATLAVQAATESQVDLSWGDTNGDESGYLVERCVGAGCSNFSPLATLLPAGSTGYSDLKLPVNTTYRYRVSAVKNASCPWQAASSSVSATTSLLAPTALSAQGENSTQVALAWTNRTTTETGIKIERCAGVGCSDFREMYLTSARAASYKDTSVCAGTVYSYRVRAANSLAPWDSSYSETAVTATPQIGNLLVDPGFENGGSGWSQPVGTALGTSFDAAVAAEGTRSLKLAPTGVQLGRAQTVSVVPTQQYLLSGQLKGALTSGGGRCRLSGSGINSPGIGISFGSSDNNAGWKSFSETVTIPPGTSSVAVQCYADAGSSGALYVDGLTLSMGSFPLSAVEVNETKISLSWPDSTSDESGYGIYRCSGDGCSNFTSLTSVAANVTTFTDGGLTPNTVYRYQVQPYKNATCGWNGAGGAVAQVTTAILPPSAVTGALANSTQINLSWTNNTATESAVVVEKCVGAGCSNFTPVTLPPRTSSWADTFVSVGTTYQYRVRATNGGAGWDSGPSATVAVSSPPLTPPALNASSQSDTRVYLWWTDPTTDESGYSVQRCTVPVGQTSCTDFAVKGTLGAGVTAFTDTVPGVATYQYRVIGSKTANSSWSNTSNVVTLTPVPPAPTLYSIGAYATTQLNLYSSMNTSTQSAVLVERCQGAGCSSFAQVGTVLAYPWRYNDSAVCAGTTYNYRLRASNTKVDTVPWTSGYSVVVAGTTPVPLPPTAFSAARSSEVQVALSWTRNTFSDTEGYNVYRCSGAGCSFGSTPYAVLPGWNSTAYTDTVVPDGVYQYKVSAYKSAASASCPWESAATAPVQATATLLAPSQLTASAMNSANVQLTWQDNTASETSFQVERCAVPNGSTSCNNFSLIAQPAANAAATASFVDSTVLPSTSYQYRVRATSTGSPAWTTAYSATSAPVTTAFQGPPSNLQASAAATKVVLAWADNTPDETGFTVYRCQGSGCSDFASLATVAANASATAGYTDNTVCGGLTYRYQIVANRGAGDTAPSEAVSATTLVPEAPVLSAARASETQINLSWNDPTSDETGYYLERCTGSGCNSFGQIAQLTANATTYADTAVMPGYSYSYRVKGYSTVSCGWQTVSAAAGAVTGILAPTALSAAVPSSTQVDLAWSDANSYSTGYRIERCTGAACADFREIALTAGAAPSYSDTGVSAGTAYRYRVRATRTVPYQWNSDYSQPVQATTPPPVAPGGLSAHPSSTTQVNLSWVSGSADVSGYAIERCSGAGCTSFAELTRVGSGATTYASQGLTPSTSYCYRVRGYKSSTAPWYSGYSPVACAVTVMDGPSTLSATALNSMTVHLAWPDSSQGEDGYNVETLLPSGQWTTVASLGADSTSYDDSVGISPLHSYSYRVRSFRGPDYSVYSAPATARTPVYSTGDNTCSQQATDAPVFSSLPVTTGKENTLYSYQVAATAVGGGSLSYSLSSKPTGMTISSQGVITWTPDYDQEGNRNVTVRVTDAALRSADQSFAIAVQGSDRAPTVGAVANQSVSVGHPFTLRLAAADADGDPLSYTLQAAPPGMSVSEDGVISWTPSAPLAATPVTARVSDGTLSTAASFTVSAGASRALSVTSTPVTSAMDGVPYLYQVAVDNPDGYPLSYALASAPAGMTVSAAGRISWIPGAAQVGNNPVTLTVSDGVQQASHPFTVQVAQNNVPYVKSTPVTTAATLAPYSYPVTAVSPAGGTLSYSLTSAPSGMSVSPAGVISWIPTINQWGNYPVSLKVTAGSSSTTHDFSIRVQIPAPTGLSPNGGYDNACGYWYPSTLWSAVPASVQSGHTAQYAVVVGDALPTTWQSTLNGPYLTVPPSQTVAWKVYSRDSLDTANQNVAGASAQEWGSCGGSSCPLIYAWNGTEYRYQTDLQGPAISQVKKGTRNVTLYGASYQVLNELKGDAAGYFRVKIWESLHEATFLDEAKLLVVDLPKGYEIASSGAENTYYYGYANPFKLYTVKDPVLPYSASDKGGNDVLAALSAVDDAPAPMLPDDPDNYYTLDFGTVEHPEYAKLVIDGWQDINSKIYNSTITVVPYVEVPDASGAWVKVKSFGMPAGDLKTMVVDLSNAFICSDQRIRIHLGIKKAQVWVIDRIRLDDSAPVDVEVRELPAVSADLGMGGHAIQWMPNPQHRLIASDEAQPLRLDYFGLGSYTRYGDVSDLLTERDDKYVVMRYADKLELTFPSLAAAPAEGKRRAFVLKADLYYKDFMEYSYVEPLPFHGMSDYPYPATESYPADAAHQEYRQQYNTRTFQ